MSLPQLDDVGWAVIDYIQHGRPETASPKVFVKHRHPFDTFGGSASVATRLSRHAARAGIEFPPEKVCGMHSLRGSLAVAMIGNGTPIQVVSEVLGHASSDTTQAYYMPTSHSSSGHSTGPRPRTPSPADTGHPMNYSPSWKDCNYLKGP